MDRSRSGRLFRTRCLAEIGLSALGSRLWDCAPALYASPSLCKRMTIEQIYREESGRILATLIRLLGDFDLAEEALQEAFAAALAQWPAEGTPASPRAW